MSQNRFEWLNNVLNVYIYAHTIHKLFLNCCHLNHRILNKIITTPHTFRCYIFIVFNFLCDFTIIWIHTMYILGTSHLSNVLCHSFTVRSSPRSSAVSAQSRGSLPPTAPSRRLCAACSRICCSKSGCSRSSSADGRSSGSGWRHRVKRSWRSGEISGGRGSGPSMWPICNNWWTRVILTLRLRSLHYNCIFTIWTQLFIRVVVLDCS